MKERTDGRVRGFLHTDNAAPHHRVAYTIWTNNAFQVIGAIPRQSPPDTERKDTCNEDAPQFYRHYRAHTRTNDCDGYYTQQRRRVLPMWYGNTGLQVRASLRGLTFLPTRAWHLSEGRSLHPEWLLSLTNTVIVTITAPDELIGSGSCPRLIRRRRPFARSLRNQVD